MKPLRCAIATSVVLASLTIPALQARADDDVRSNPAWAKGYADGTLCATNIANCKFDIPYPVNDSSKITEEQSSSNSDYIAGFIVGKSVATK